MSNYKREGGTGVAIELVKRAQAQGGTSLYTQNTGREEKAIEVIKTTNSLSTSLPLFTALNSKT